MSQWNAYNANVREIYWGELNHTPTPIRTKHRTSNSTIATKYLNKISKTTHSSEEDITSHFSTDNSFNTSMSSESDVFQDPFETPTEKDSSFSRNPAVKRSLSLPAHLRCELQENETSIEKDSYHPRRLFKKAINLESYRRNVSITGSKLNDDIFVNVNHETLPEQSRVGQMNGQKPLMTYDSNNNYSYDHGEIKITKQSCEVHNNSNFDMRKWERQVMVITSEFDFGTELSRKSQNKLNNARSRSVALTDNILRINNKAIRLTKGQETKDQVVSETQYEMSKLKSVARDYIRSKSTKRKNVKQNSDKLRRTEVSCLKNTHNYINGDKDHGSMNVQQVTNCSSERTSFIVTQEKKGKVSPEINGLTSWVSNPSLTSNKSTPAQYQSCTDLSQAINEEPQPIIKDQDINAENLKFLLTTGTKKRSLQERMKTLHESRDWLMKELKSMRDEDRNLARQFINLRSAIVEVKEYLEQEDSESEEE